MFEYIMSNEHDRERARACAYAECLSMDEHTHTLALYADSHTLKHWKGIDTRLPHRRMEIMDCELLADVIADLSAIGRNAITVLTHCLTQTIEDRGDYRRAAVSRPRKATDSRGRKSNRRSCSADASLQNRWWPRPLKCRVCCSMWSSFTCAACTVRNTKTGELCCGLPRHIGKVIV